MWRCIRLSRRLLCSAAKFFLCYGWSLSSRSSYSLACADCQRWVRGSSCCLFPCYKQFVSHCCSVASTNPLFVCNMATFYNLINAFVFRQITKAHVSLSNLERKPFIKHVANVPSTVHFLCFVTMCWFFTCLWLIAHLLKMQYLVSWWDLHDVILQHEETGLKMSVTELAGYEISRMQSFPKQASCNLISRCSVIDST